MKKVKSSGNALPPACTSTPGKIIGVALLSPAQSLQLRIRMRDFDVFVGIDPGDTTGYATWYKVAKKLNVVSSDKIHIVMNDIQFLLKLHNPNRILVRIEDARLRTYLPKEKDNSAYRGKLMGAGSIKRDCSIWEDFLTDLKIPFELLAPAAGRTKWSAEYFQSLTKYQGRTNNHGRDAAALVFGL